MTQDKKRHCTDGRRCCCIIHCQNLYQTKSGVWTANQILTPAGAAAALWSFREDLLINIFLSKTRQFQICVSVCLDHEPVLRQLELRLHAAALLRGDARRVRRAVRRTRRRGRRSSWSRTTSSTSTWSIQLGTD